MNIGRFCIMLSAFLVLPAIAQKRKPQPLSPEQQERIDRLQRMVEKTQRVMFIDSFVVDKSQIVETYRLSPEAGRIEQKEEGLVYENELGTQRFISGEVNDSTTMLFRSSNINQQWTEPTPLNGICNDSTLQSVGYPYMMGDGQTFYFAAKSSEGVGGYDIYVTRYDEEEGTFLHPANIGMPFNSEANDYLYVIDEYSNLGWFATDRNQPEGKVCVYVFIPTQIRQIYSREEYSSDEIAAFARISCIADTWTDSIAREEALARLEKISVAKDGKMGMDTFTFVVNNHVTYHRLSDFRDPENQQRYQQLKMLRERYALQDKALEQARDYYATAKSEKRELLRKEVLTAEQQQHEVWLKARQLEKVIRNQENHRLTKD